MRIAYLGDFSVFYSTELYIASALRTLGHDVLKIEELSIYGKTVEQVAANIRSMDVDFVLFCKVRSVANATQLIEVLKKSGVYTVTWLFDLFFDLPKRRSFQIENNLAPFNADIIFSTDGGHKDEFTQLKINHHLLRQGIHEPDAHYGVPVLAPLVPKVVFVGTDVYLNRSLMLRKLDKKFRKEFGWYGNNPTTVVRGQALNNLFAGAKVVVGDSQPSPYYWSNRIYETLGRGGFLIHPRVKGLEKEFEYYKHFIPYDYGHYEQLIEIIEYYLAHDAEREAIRKAGHEFCKAHYTYTIRCTELLNQITHERAK